MQRVSPAALADLGPQLDSLLNQLDEEIPGGYSDRFQGQVLRLILQTERLLAPNPSERQLLAVSKALLNSGQANLALSKLEEALIPRLPRR